MSFSSTILALNPAYGGRSYRCCLQSCRYRVEKRALDIVQDLCLDKDYLSADDLIAKLGTDGSLVAVAGVFKAAQKKGWLEPARCECGMEVRTKESTRIGNHGRKIILYKSLFC